MNIFQIGTIVVLAIFYMVYIGKMISQRKKGIQTDQIAKGKKHTSVFLIEVIMKCATYGIVLVQLISVMIDWNWMPAGVRYIGVVIAMTLAIKKITSPTCHLKTNNDINPNARQNIIFVIG